MTGVVVIYACLCSDGADTLDELPDRCAGHDKPRVSSWTNPGMGALRGGHDCPRDHPCATSNQENP